MVEDILDGRTLRAGTVAHLVWAVIFHSRRDDHTVDIDIGERILIFVGSPGVTCTAFGRTAIGHQGPHLLACAYNDDAGIGNLGILVGCYMVLVVVGGVFLGFLNVCAFSWFGDFGLRIAGCGVEGDVLFACLHPDEVFDLHAECHEMVAERFAVAEP